MKENQQLGVQRLEFEVKRPSLPTEIIIGKNILENIVNIVDLSAFDFSAYSQLVIITEEKIKDKFGTKLKRGLSPTGLKKINIFNIEEGEINKTEEKADEVTSKILAIEDPPIDRRILMVALGGGKVGDMTGYIAGKLLRGVDYIQIPTTLLAMVDSSIGGKVAVNHKNFTNMVGLFHLPKVVIMDTETLNTLPDREFKSGMGELIKYAFLYPKLFQALSDINPENMKNNPKLIELIKLAVEYKMHIVGQDFEEKTGLREVLNLGHTIGRALETAAGLKGLTHGEAVAIGTFCEIKFSHMAGFLSDKDMEKMIALIKKFDLPTKVSNINTELFWEALSHDKKSIKGESRFVLLSGIGEPISKFSIDRKAIEQILKQIIE